MCAPSPAPRGKSWEKPHNLCPIPGTPENPGNYFSRITLILRSQKKKKSVNRICKKSTPSGFFSAARCFFRGAKKLGWRIFFSSVTIWVSARTLPPLEQLPKTKRLISYLKSDQSWISTEETNAKNMDFTPSKPKFCTPCKRCFLVVKSPFSVTSSLLKILCIDKIGSRPRRILCVDKIASRPRGILVFAHFLFENR